MRPDRPSPAADSRLRLVEPLAALSLMTDLARGQPSGQSLRACLLATRLAGLAGLAPHEASDVYYATLLRFVGCTATSHDYARYFGGDDIDVRRRGDLVDVAEPRELLAFALGLGRSGPVLARGRVVARTLTRGAALQRAAVEEDCEVAALMARRFGLGEAIAAALAQHFERWDGRGSPGGLAGDAISPAARFASLATAAVMFADAFGPQGALEAVGRWAGRGLDPALATLFLDHARELDDPPDAWRVVLDAEPAPVRSIGEARLDDVLTAFAEVADLKSTYLLGHSTGVAELAGEAATLLGMTGPQVVRVRRAGLLHDVGRVLVPTGVWDRPGPLTTADWELVRLHPYHTERILSSAPRLAPLARLASMHHERLNGTGYHRGAGAGEQDLSTRVLAAADSYHAMTEDRPHRPAHAAREAARLLRAESLDPDAVEAVLAAAGHAAGRARRGWPEGLTDREIDVLRRLVRGLSMREIGQVLHISTSTVHTHIAHIYEKTGVSTRAAAALFAMEHGLLAR